MFQSLVRSSFAVASRAAALHPAVLTSRLGGVRYSSGHEETDAEFDCRKFPFRPLLPLLQFLLFTGMTDFFKRKDIDGWDIRRGLQELFTIDGVPEPDTIVAALHSIRRVNDFALAIRFLETLKYKAANNKNIYPYLIQEMTPTLKELGISTPEGMCPPSPSPRYQWACSSPSKNVPFGDMH